VGPGASTAIQLEGRIDVPRILHVDPQVVVSLICPLEQPIQVPLAESSIEIETELRGLDGDLRVESGRGHSVEGIQVMQRHGFGLVRGREVLAERRQNSGDPLPFEIARGLDRILQSLARHELPHRAPDERRLRRTIPKPGVRRPGQ
jgi:hypothetical protein